MILKKLPPAKKDQLAADLVNANKDQLVQLLTDLARQNGVTLNISELTAKAET
jgi:hypothetical protein